MLAILKDMWRQTVEDFSVFNGSKPFFKRAAVWAALLAMMSIGVAMYLEGVTGMTVFVIGSFLWFIDIMLMVAILFFLFKHFQKFYFWIKALRRKQEEE